MAYWFGLHSLHKLDLWKVFCILLNFAYFQQQNTGTYRSKFNFFFCFFVIANENDSKLCIREIFVFFRVEYSIVKLVKTFAQNYHTNFLATFTFCTLYSTFLRVFLSFTFFQLSNVDRCLHHASTEVFLYFNFYTDKACMLLFKKSEYRRIFYLSGIKNSTVTFFTQSIRKVIGITFLVRFFFGFRFL